MRKEKARKRLEEAIKEMEAEAMREIGYTFLVRKEECEIIIKRCAEEECDIEDFITVMRDSLKLIIESAKRRGIRRVNH